LCFTFDFYGMIIVGGRVFKELDVNCNKNWNIFQLTDINVSKFQI
jgi:predicted nucleic acid-binding protein